MCTLLEKVKEKDAEAVKIIAERPIVIHLGSVGENMSEVLYEDKGGNQFTTAVSYRNNLTSTGGR